MPKQTFFNLPDDKRERIEACAIEEFAGQGYKGASVSRLVAAAGIAKGSFYQYFEDMDDLYIHIVRTKIADRKLATYQREKRRLEDLNLSEFLRLVFHQQLTQFRQEPSLLRIGLELMQLTGEPVFRRVMDQYQAPVTTYFLPFIQHEVDQGEIDPAVNAQLLNFMLVSLGQYMIHLLTAADTVNITPELLDKIVDDLDYILRNGIYTDSKEV